jgi:proteasome lid subunit RPN8/RPN11
MAVVVRLKQAHLDAMINHALEDAPVECCGFLATKDGAVVSITRAANTEASPFRFNIDPREYLRAERAMDERGEVFAGLYHSHTGTEPKPSPTDIRAMSALFGPPHVHFVIGVADRDHPIARVFEIEDGVATELDYEVIG